MYHHSKTILLYTLGKQLFLSAYIKKIVMQKLATAQIRKIRIGYILKSADVLSLSLQKIFWKFIQHTDSQTLVHFRRLPPTPIHTCAYCTHPHTPMYVYVHPHPPTYMYVNCTHMCTPAHTRTHPRTPTHTRTHLHIPYTYPLMPLTQ